MYNCVSLTRKNLEQLLKLSSKRKQFNILNEDFFEHYYQNGFTRQLLMCRRVKLLKCNNEIVGYIWTSGYSQGFLSIYSMYVDQEDDLLKKYDMLIHSLKVKSKAVYNCEKNVFNYKLLSEIGFVKKEGTYEMKSEVGHHFMLENNKDIVFEQFQRGRHEEVRCIIQNEVFKNQSRIPLTKDDIYYDQTQPYYFEKGSILIKKNNKYIGYGQIIFNETIPTIVNIGIVSEFRGKGYGKALLFYLLNLLNEEGIKEVNLKVASDNFSALNLYKSLGFTIVKESNLWEYKK
jgi:ribosomal protein S18 acetylase RimI-like enzyme